MPSLAPPPTASSSRTFAARRAGWAPNRCWLLCPRTLEARDLTPALLALLLLRGAP